MRREGWWALLALGVGGLAADRVFASYWDFPTAAGELPDAVRAYRAAGLPWTAADIAPPPVPEAQNAAAPLRAAIAALSKGKRSSETEEHWRYGEPIGSLTPFARALGLAHFAAQKPKLNFARDWKLGSDLNFPEEAYIERICRLFAMRAVLRAKAGDDVAALADLQDARLLATLISSEPILVSLHAGVFCDGLAMTGVQRCLVAAHADPVRLARYRKLLAISAPLPDLVRALRGQIYMAVTNARNLDRIGIGWGLLPYSDLEPFGDTPEEIRGDYRNDPKPASRRADGLPENTRSRAYMRRCLQSWTELAQSTHGLSDSIDAINREAETIEGRNEKARGMSHGFDAMLFPVFGNLPRMSLVVRANRAVTLALADALILHTRTGRWPTALKTPDPLGTGPLRVRFDGRRFRVWSVGRNGKDEGGLLSRETEEGKISDDIVAAYPPIPPARRPPSEEGVRH